MKITKLLIAIATMPLVGACTSVREDPRSHSHRYESLYQNGSNAANCRSGSVRVSVSEPQPTPIRVKPGTQPTHYLNTSSPYDTPANGTASPYDRPGSESPLRHDTPDQTSYKR